MPVRDILSRAGSPTSLVGLALILASLWTAREARAQQSEAARPLERALPPALLPTEAQDKDAAPPQPKDKLKEPTDKGQPISLGDMAQALLSSAEEPDAEVRKARVQRFLAGVKKAIEEGNANQDPALREAVAVLVGEFAASARGGLLGTRSSNQLVIDVLPPLADAMAALGKTDTSADVRAAAARTLAKLPSAADPSIAIQESILRDPERKELHAGAKDDLSRLRPAVGVAVGTLETMLKDDKNPEVRRAAAGALTSVLKGTVAADRGAFAAPVVEPSRYNLILCGPTVARAAGSVLSGRESDPEVRRRSAAALLQVGSTLNSQLRAGATETLSDLHGALEPVQAALWKQIDALSTAAQDGDPEVRHTGLRALEEMGDVRLHWLWPSRETLPFTPTPEGKPRKPGKPTAAASPGELSGLNLTYVTYQAQPPKPETERFADLYRAIPALTRSLADDNVRNRLAAIDALETITARPRDLPAPPPTVAQELGARPAAEAAKALTRALSDRDRFVRWAAARTLGKMAPLDDVENGKQVQHGAIAGLALLLSDSDPDLRLRVAEALADFGKAACDAVPALAVAASRGDEEARIAAAHAILVIGGSPEVAVPALVTGLDNPNTRLRRASAEALAKYGAEARAARPALQRALRDSDPEVRRLVSDALIKIGTGK
jgi:HEAT repeat protein